MTSKILPFFSILHFLFITISVLLQALFGSTNPSELYYQSCGNTFNCGYITGIGYPFRGSNDPLYCGYPNLVLSCDDQTNITTINITNTTYRVLDVYPATQTMRIVRQDVTTETCPQQMVNTTLDHSLFDYTATSMNYTFLYKCPDSNPPGFSLLCGYNSAYESVYVVRGAQGPGSCKASVVVPVHETGHGGGLLFGNDTAAFGEAMKQGFEIRWTIASEACSVCAESNGRCGYDMMKNQTTCFCPDPPYVSRTCIPIDTATSSPSPTPPSPGMFSSKCLQSPPYI